jgi:O-Antigen ligase
MNNQSSVTSRSTMTVSTLLAAHKRRDMLLFITIFIFALGLTPLLILAGATAGFNLVLTGLAVLTIATLIVWRPIIGLYLVVGLTVLIEEEPLPTPILTDRLNVYYWPPALEGLIERPIGFLFIFIILVFIGHRLLRRQRLMWGGPLLPTFLLFLLCVGGGVIHGLTSGGDLKMIVLEVRPFWYLFVSYFLAYNLITQKRQIYILLWIVILGAAVKAVQGLYIYLIVLHGDLTNQNAILEHQESFFFAAALLLLLLFCLHYRDRPQFYATLFISPAVLVALVANQRRADYIALIAAMGAAWALIFLVKPLARKWLLIGMLVCVVLTASYIAVFSNSTSTLAKPAHAIVSVFSPDLATDAVKFDSNLYRTIENNDLLYTVKQNPLIGFGFGKPFPEPFPLTSIYPDVLAADPVYNYIPHNTIYWIWMRLGSIGFLAFWYLIGTMIVRGSLIVRQLKDAYLQLVAIYIVGVIFMEIIVAYADYQLYNYRNVIYVGLLIGVLMRLPVLAEKKTGRSDRLWELSRVSNHVVSAVTHLK